MALQMVAMEVEFGLTLKNREYPIYAPTQFLFPKEKFPETIEELTDLAVNWINKQLDSRSVYTITLESAKHAKFIVKTELIEGVHVPAPDEMPPYVLVTLDGDDEEEDHEHH